jgi:hypothetical protein
MPPSPFCSGYSGGRASRVFQMGPDHDSPVLSFPPLLGWQVCASMPSIFPLR